MPADFGRLTGSDVFALSAGMTVVRDAMGLEWLHADQFRAETRTDHSVYAWQVALDDAHLHEDNRPTEVQITVRIEQRGPVYMGEMLIMDGATHLYRALIVRENGALRIEYLGDDRLVSVPFCG